MGECQILGLKENVGTLPERGRKRANPTKARECESGYGGGGGEQEEKRLE